MIFPFPAPPPTIVVDGAVVRSYNPPFVSGGHVMAPVDPFIVRVAGSIGYSGGFMIVTRGDRFAQVRVRFVPAPQSLQNAYVEIAPILRTLGIRVEYDAAHRRLLVDAPPAPLAFPTPFNPAVPRVAPRVVFTPAPVATPRPVVSGSPSPRRTPIPAAVPPPTPFH